MVATKPRRRQPRIPPMVRLRIIQLRAINRERPLSVRAILHQLASEGVLVGLGSVQNIVKAWEDRGAEEKWPEMAFEWRHLDRARVDWDASRWLTACQLAHELPLLNDGSQEIYLWDHPFTNRWACWCWRVHLLAPDLRPAGTLIVARIYAAMEHLASVAPGAATTHLRWLEDYLRFAGNLYGQDQEVDSPARRFPDAFRQGHVADLPTPMEMRDMIKNFKIIDPTDSGGIAASAASIELAYKWVDSWHARIEEGDLDGS